MYRRTDILFSLSDHIDPSPSPPSSHLWMNKVFTRASTLFSHNPTTKHSHASNGQFISQNRLLGLFEFGTADDFASFDQPPLEDTGNQAISINTRAAKQEFTSQTFDFQLNQDSSITMSRFGAFSGRMMHSRSNSSLSAPAAFRGDAINNAYEYDILAKHDHYTQVSLSDSWSTKAKAADESPIQYEIDNNFSSTEASFDPEHLLHIKDSLPYTDSAFGDESHEEHNTSYGVSLVVCDSVSFVGRGWSLHTVYSIDIEVSCLLESHR